MIQREIDCEQALRQIFEFVDRELDESDHQAMHRHLQTCKSCFSRMEFERRLKEKLGALREESVSPEAGKRIKKLIENL